MIPSEEGLLLHLPCTEAEGELLTDTSPAAGHVTLPEGVEIRPDIDLGRALAFNRGAQRCEVKLAKLPEWGLTLAAWIRADAATADRKSVSILQYPVSATTHAAPYFVFGLYLVEGKLHARIGQRDAGQTERVIAPEKWHHVALTWYSNTKTATYYFDGKPLPVMVAGQPVEAFDTGIGVLNYPDATLPLLLGANAVGREKFSGRMSGLRIYGRALPAAEMAALVHEEKHARTHPFDHHHPLGFRVADDREHPSVYIVEESSHGRTLNLILTNASPIAIELPPSIPRTRAKLDLVGMHRPTLDDHHLEIVFRPGTLKDVARISPVDTDWHLRGVQNEEGTLSIYLSRPYGLVIPPGGVLTISLAHIQAIAVGGSRSTQVELRYRHLRYLGDDHKLGSHRLAHLDVVNQRGRSDPPLAAGFIGSNTVLNDGRTLNTLTLYLGNSTLEKLSLAAGELQVRPRLLLSFDSGQLDEKDEPWALGHADEVAEIEITSSELGWIIHERAEAETPEWVILPPEVDFLPNKWINFTLYPIVTRSPSGFTNLYLRYQNIAGFRDGQIAVPIEKAPRLYRQQPVPESKSKAANPDARRSVHAFADSVVIGSGYATERANDTPAPPAYPEANSLLVEGSVGIGTDSDRPKAQLHVNGDYYGRGHQWLHAYEGDGQSGTAYVQARDTSGRSSLALQLHTQNQGAIIDTRRLTPEGDAKVRGIIEDKHGPVVPIGTIVMWSNYQGRSIPAGWVLCDGNNNTPDLRGRFVVGAGKGTYAHGEVFDFPPPDPGGNPNGEAAPAQIGGCLRVTLSESEMAHHRHGGTTNTDGLHYHHVPVWANEGRNKTEYPPGNPYQFKDLDQAFEKIPDRGPTTSTHPSAHHHSFTTDVGTGKNAPHENLPPYFVLSFIMKVS